MCPSDTQQSSGSGSGGGPPASFHPPAADRAALEAEIRRLWEASDMAGAVTSALRGYGPEILGVLLAVTRSEDDAHEAFAQFSEDLWKGIEAFAWRSSFRTWAYSIAHHASVRVRSATHRRAGRNVPISQTSVASHIAAEVRERTLPYLKTDVKDKFAQLREELAPDDQLLLILRVDKQMAWGEIVGILDGEGADKSEQALKRRAATLRKRFQLLKEQIRARAVAMGLIEDETR